jgi:23S rRNA (pseudouridine1915-N3)-methyltransferase
VRILVRAVGGIGSGPEAELCDLYAGRVGKIGRGLGVARIDVAERAESRARTAEERKSAEARDLLAQVPAGGVVVALDERGEALGSVAFARLIEAHKDGGTGTLAFLLGGPDGHGAEVTARAARVLSFGPATYPHALARVLLLEQIYRALTILAGHPYHRA